MVNKTADFEHCYLCHECIVIFLILNTFTTKVGGEFKWSSQQSSLLPNQATAVLNLPARLKFLVAPGKRASVNVEHWGRGRTYVKKVFYAENVFHMQVTDKTAFLIYALILIEHKKTVITYRKTNPIQTGIQHGFQASYMYVPMYTGSWWRQFLLLSCDNKHSD